MEMRGPLHSTLNRKDFKDKIKNNLQNSNASSLESLNISKPIETQDSYANLTVENSDSESTITDSKSTQHEISNHSELENDSTLLETCNDDSIISSSKQDLSLYEFSENENNLLSQSVLYDISEGDEDDYKSSKNSEKSSEVSINEPPRISAVSNDSEKAILLKAAWSAFDIDNDGKISNEEFKNFMSGQIVTSRTGILPKWQINSIFRSLDGDGNGQIDFDEFLKIVKEDDNGEMVLQIPLRFCFDS